MKIGFIGVEHIGRTLVDAFIQAQVFLPHEIVFSNHSNSAMNQLASKYPSMLFARHNQELVREATCFFICVKPSAYHSVLHEIKEVVQPDQIAIFISSLVKIEDLDNLIECKVANIFPRVNCDKLDEICLYTLGSRMNPMEQFWLQQLLSTICNPVLADESVERISPDLSCSQTCIAYSLD